MPDGCPIEEVVLNLEPQVDEVEIGAAGLGGPTHWAAVADKPDFDALYDPAGAASAAQAAAAIYATEKAGSAQAAAAADATAKANAAQTAAVDTLRAGVAADGDTLAKLRALIQGIQTLLTSDRLDLDTLQEVVDFVEVHQSSLESLGTGKVNVSDIINVLTDASTAKPLSAAQGKVLKDLIDAWGSVVGMHVANRANPHGVTAAQVGADPVGAAASAQAAAIAAAAADATAKANAAQTAAVDTLRAGVAADGDTLAKLRALIQGIQTLLTSDRLDLDTLQEVVDFVEVHQSSLESLGTGKVNVSDIINVLTDASTAKPLSAAQGKVLKDLIDALVVVVSGKEPAILSDTSDKYLRGDKTWADFAANVRMTVLTGLSTASASVITAADSVLVATGKLQAQISDVITQTEAETGTSTTRRSWTAQRVRQATAAWWLTASSALGRTLASVADASAGRTALGLGSASVLAAGQADAAVPTMADIRSYYGSKYKPAVAPTLVIDFENSYFAIYTASTNILFVADNWDAFATYLGADLTIGRAGEQTHFDALGTMRTAAVNTIQCDHDPITGQRLGPYIGSARTNILLNSEAPATQSVNVTAQAYTLSFYGTGSIALSGAHTATLVGSGAFPVRSTLTFTPTDGTLTLTVSGVQKFQLEAGVSASPYIPTTTAAVTRPATAVTIGGIKFTGAVSGSEATLVAKAITADVITADRRICMLSDGTVNNRFSLHINGSSIRVYANASGAFLYGPSVGTAFVGVPFSVALSGKSGRYASACKGVAAAEGLVSGFGAFNRVQIGYGVTSQQFDGWVQAVTVYPRALNTSQDTELSK